MLFYKIKVNDIQILSKTLFQKTRKKLHYTGKFSSDKAQSQINLTQF